jgi:hypothetical protein
MVVAAVAHPTAAATKDEKGERPHSKRHPNPIAAKPAHRRVPSVTKAIPGLSLCAIATKVINAPRGLECLIGNQ